MGKVPLSTPGRRVPYWRTGPFTPWSNMPRHEESSKNPLVQGKTYSWHTETQKNVARKKTYGFLYIFPKINPWTKSRQDVLNWRFGRMGWNRATNYLGSCTISETANACILSQGNQCGASKHALEDDKNRNSGFTHKKWWIYPLKMVESDTLR